MKWITRDPAAIARAMQARRAAAATDLFLPNEDRLRDDDRATIERLLRGIVDGIEHVMRRRLADALADQPLLARSFARHSPCAWPILQRTGALHDPALVGTLAQRAEEGRIVARLRYARDRAIGIEAISPSPLDDFARAESGRIAVAARNYLKAARTRCDAAGVPVIGQAELPADMQHGLVWRVAAGLRGHAVACGTVEPAMIDPFVAAAAAATLSGYDESDTPPALAQALAHALHAAGLLDDEVLVGALASGEPGFVAAALAERGGIGFAMAWRMMLDPEGLFLLCRAGGLSPAVAADLAVRLATDDDDEALADRLDDYAALAPHRAAAALTLWRVDPAYRDAIAALSGSAG